MINHSAPPFTLMQLLNSVQLPKEDVDRVISFIRSLAEADNDEAEQYLGEMYSEGKYMPQSYSEAAGWFERCDNHSSGAIGPWMNCARALGKMYLQGQGVISDPGKAANYYQQLFDAGGRTDPRTDPSVEDILMPMYCGGAGIPMDRAKAFAIYKKDDYESFGALGVGAMYQMGWGVEQDLAEAFNWYRKAAADKNYGSAKAKTDFTRIFRDCKGTPENFNAAVSLYEKASAGQH
jgi:TPR repeat protein